MFKGTKADDVDNGSSLIFLGLSSKISLPSIYILQEIWAEQNINMINSISHFVGKV